MRAYLVTAQGSEEDKHQLSAVVEAYLTSVLLPAQGSHLGLRDQQELRTLARAFDQLVKGNIAEACDFLIQRFKAVETAPATGWQVARHLELVPSEGVTSVSSREREMASGIESRQQRLQAQISRSRQAPR